MRDYLIYTSAGSASNIKQWYASSNKNYDIWVTNYTNTQLLNKEYSDFYNEHKGSKWQNLKAVFLKSRKLLSNYKAIMVLDDDIIISPNSLSELFNTLTKKDLWMLHPAFSRFGKISHNITKRQLFNSLRYTNFVEVGCPVFRTDKLFDFLTVYEPEKLVSFGLDFWFSHHFGIDIQNRYAISDKYYCINPHDGFKRGGTREMNKHSSAEERILMWERFKHERGINNFEFRDYNKIKKNIFGSVCTIPVYTLEVLFSKVLSLRYNLKKAFRVEKTQT